MKRKSLIFAGILLLLVQISQPAQASLAAQAVKEEDSGRKGAVLSVRAFGALGDGKSKDTAAFQKALDACGGEGGGTVEVEAGKYLIGSVQIRSGTTLVLEKGAVVMGSPSAADYPLVPVRFEGALVQGHRALVYAENADHIRILGPGTFVGDNRIGNLRNPRGPVMIELNSCSDVELNGFSDRYRRLWSVHLLFCKNVVTKNLFIRTTLSNGDGIDVDSCARIVIENCDIDTGDDAISLKSGRGASAVKLNRPTEDVVIRDCSLGSGFAGIGIGTEMSGGIRNVWIQDCVFPRGVNAIFIKSRSGRGGYFENIGGENLTASSRTFLGISLRDMGIIGVDPVEGMDGIPQLKNVWFSGVKVNCQTLVDGSRVLAAKPIDGLALSNISGTSRRGITLANAGAVSLSDIHVSGISGPLLQTRNVSGSGLDGAIPLRVGMMDDPEQLRSAFEQPPDDARPMVRWWWFGDAVTKPELLREMQAMKSGGFGGFEATSCYPLAVDGEIPGVANLKFLSPEYLDAIKYVAAEAKELGLRMDLTIATGWPYGGPEVSLEDSAGRFRVVHERVDAKESDVSAPTLREGEAVIAAFDDSQRMLPLKDGAAQIPATEPSTRGVTYFISSHTGMKVKRAALGGEGYVLDHQTAGAVQRFIEAVAEKQLEACGENTPYAIFCDSLESYGENWTADFLNEFQKRRGYDLRPLLAALVSDIGPKTQDIRCDWGKTLTELLNDNFVRQMRSFADKHNTRFRMQAYGQPAAGQFTYARVNLPEGEGYQWHDYRATRYATSACHLMGVPVCSSETFTWIHSQPFRATPLDIKAEADLHFLQGVNQIICHGWPYTATGVGFPGWSFYAAGVFDDQNPWNIVMPDVTRYLQRVSFMLRQGTPSNDVALYLPNSDAWARFSPGDGRTRLQNSLTDELGECLGHRIVGSILDAGYNLDFFDDEMLNARGSVDSGGSLLFGGRGAEGNRADMVRYHVVVLAGVERIPLETMRKLADFATRGGVLVATRRLPTIVPGYLASDADQRQLHELVDKLFKGPEAPAIFVTDEAQIGAALEKDHRVPPDVKLSPATPEIGFVRRNAEDAAIYFVANTSNEPKNVTASFRFESLVAQQLDATTGRISSLEIIGHPEGYSTVKLSLAPYESTFVLLSNRMAGTSAAPSHSEKQSQNISDGWSVAFGPDETPVVMEKLHSWTDDDATRAFSGVATYTRRVMVSPAMVSAGKVFIDFGDGQASAPARPAEGFAAMLDAPVRDAAAVYVNGQRAGSVWCAPFRLEIGAYLKPGNNELRVDVGNTAMNYLAAKGFPNYDFPALVREFGERFRPIPAAQFRALPSGLLGRVALVTGP